MSKPLPKAAVHAAAKTLVAAGSIVKSYYKLTEVEIADGFHVPDYRTFHIFESTDWGDGTKPSISTTATFRGCEHSYRHAAQMLLCLRADEQGRYELCKDKSSMRVTFTMMAEINKIGEPAHGSAGWLNCENLEVKIFEHALRGREATGA